SRIIFGVRSRARIPTFVLAPVDRTFALKLMYCCGEVESIDTLSLSLDLTDPLCVVSSSEIYVHLRYDSAQGGMFRGKKQLSHFHLSVIWVQELRNVPPVSRRS